METLEIFKKFLIKYDVFDKFINQATQGKRNPLYSNSIPACQLIDMAFLWSWSKEGWNFWNNLDNKWKTRIRDYNQDNYYTFTEVNEYLSTNTESLWTD